MICAISKKHDLPKIDIFFWVALEFIWFNSICFSPFQIKININNLILFMHSSTSIQIVFTEHFFVIKQFYIIVLYNLFGQSAFQECSFIKTSLKIFTKCITHFIFAHSRPEYASGLEWKWRRKWSLPEAKIRFLKGVTIMFFFFQTILETMWFLPGARRWFRTNKIEVFSFFLVFSACSVIRFPWLVTQCKTQSGAGVIANLLSMKDKSLPLHSYLFLLGF